MANWTSQELKKQQEQKQTAKKQFRILQIISNQEALVLLFYKWQLHTE